MDAARGLGHQGFDQSFPDPFLPRIRVNPESAKFAAVRMFPEGDEADYLRGLFRDPEPVGLHAGIIQAQASGKLYGVGDVLYAGFSDAHFRSLYHARGRTEFAIIRIDSTRMVSL
jgi:hypothetical protein